VPDAPPARGRAGVEGAVGGRHVRVGSPAWVLEAAAAPAWVRPWLERQLSAGATPVLAARDGQVVLAAAFGDALRAGAHETVRRLRAGGWRVGILSGDHPDVVRAVGR